MRLRNGRRGRGRVLAAPERARTRPQSMIHLTSKRVKQYIARAFSSIERWMTGSSSVEDWPPTVDHGQDCCCEVLYGTWPRQPVCIKIVRCRERAATEKHSSARTARTSCPYAYALYEPPPHAVQRSVAGPRRDQLLDRVAGYTCTYRQSGYLYCSGTLSPCVTLPIAPQ